MSERVMRRFKCEFENLKRRETENSSTTDNIRFLTQYRKIYFSLLPMKSQ